MTQLQLEGNFTDADPGRELGRRLDQDVGDLPTAAETEPSAAGPLSTPRAPNGDSAQSAVLRAPLLAAAISVRVS